ncbi:acetyl-coenzyme A synthetase 2 [Blastocladiella emersonii ATCC 22665]|nr:acetyl-coenzyme A synthetase 2 [Blastocladiella emersonii ATCC 22665]
MYSSLTTAAVRRGALRAALRARPAPAVLHRACSHATLASVRDLAAKNAAAEQAIAAAAASVPHRIAESAAKLAAATTSLEADPNHGPRIRSMAQYKELWRQSIEDPETFFGEHARKLLSWDKPFAKVRHGDFRSGDPVWFPEGTLNASYNCLDRHVFTHPDRTALIFEPDNIDDPAQHISYRDLLKRVCKLANALHELGLRKGDRVGIYMPMVPEAAVAMLACARLGLVHMAVFAGFSPDALRDRLVDGHCKALITADEGVRAGLTVPLKRYVDEALHDAPCVQNVVVFKNTGTASTKMHAGRDHWWSDLVDAQRPYCPPVPVHAEDPIFMLYTSGSTGKPKGLVHATAGYLLGTALAAHYSFDVRPGDVFGTTADIAWIVGSSYIVYGPLTLGATAVMFAPPPTHPAPDRYWRTVAKHGITQFYTAPTAIRALRRFGDEPVKQHDLSSLRVLGTAGEPIDAKAWEWYANVVGQGRVPVVDAYWQTETGASCLQPFPGATPTPPGAATLPFFGIDPVLVDPESGKELPGLGAEGALCFRGPWPSLARTIHNDHARYESTYFGEHKGLYFTGDAAFRDADGLLWIRGRTDDVVNVAGHRLSTSEIEGALMTHETCAEAAAIGVPDEIKGQAIVAFVTVKPSTHIPVHSVPPLLVQRVRKIIGPIATPKLVVVVPELPKTRTGKQMRRVLRKIAMGEHDQLGDVSTLAEPHVVDQIVAAYAKAVKEASAASSK